MQPYVDKHPFPLKSFPSRLPHNIEQNSLCSTVGLCRLSILNIAAYNVGTWDGGVGGGRQVASVPSSEAPRGPAAPHGALCRGGSALPAVPLTRLTRAPGCPPCARGTKAKCRLHPGCGAGRSSGGTFPELSGGGGRLALPASSLRPGTAGAPAEAASPCRKRQLLLRQRCGPRLHAPLGKRHPAAGMRHLVREKGPGGREVTPKADC